MSRPIKFRAWDKSDDTMVFVDNLNWHKKRKTLNWLNSDYPIDFVLMQYTGLKDKNGVEIYEGDIVLGSDNGEFFPEEYDEKKDEFYPIGKYEVYWADGGWWLKDKDGEPIDCEYNILISPDAEFEVLGNIYENPEPKGRK